MRTKWVTLVVFAILALLPIAAQAQTGGISGVVKDSTGAVLPGVTVEASSPALIEKVRSVTTDGEGVYSIKELRPGTYTVTFTLPGFTSVKREGIELTTNFTANVNAELKVGEVTETLTVSGEAPIVDVRNNVKQAVFDRAMIENLPTTKGFGSVAVLIPGAKQTQLPDVGGTSGETYFYMGIHGSKAADQHIQYDGLDANNIHADGAANGYTLFVNPEAVQEMVVVTDNVGAEKAEGGIILNAVPKDGGNTLHFNFYGNFSGSTDGISRNPLQANNLTTDLINAGLKDVNRSINVFDLNAAIGGPIIKDKLWIFNADRAWGFASYVAGIYNPINPLLWVPNPNPNSQFAQNQHQRSIYDRLTYQANAKNKFSLSWDNQVQDAPHGTLNANPATTNTGGQTAITGTVSVVSIAGGTSSPETATHARSEPDYTVQGKWSAPISNRLLLEAGGTFTNYVAMSYFLPGVDPNIISVLDNATNYRYRAAASYRNQQTCCSFSSHMWHGRFMTSYVTGSHALKGGVLYKRGQQLSSTNIDQDVLYTFNSGVPLSLTMRTTPEEQLNSFHDVDAFAQDQWTRDRLTVNVGFLYSHIVGQADAVTLPAGRFVGIRNYPTVPDMPNWNDIVPRTSVAYDLFGNGKTALKVGFNKYLGSITTRIATLNNPQAAVANTANRSWNDTTPCGNPAGPASGACQPSYYIPNCNLLNAAANGDCGAMSVGNFGSNNVTSNIDPDYTSGWGKRDFNWALNGGVQQEIRPGMSVSVDYYRRWFGNLQVLNNTLAGPANYSPYCVNAPVDPRLPSGVSGSQICGLYDINPSSFGKVFVTRTFASNFGGESDVFNGLDLTMKARIAGGGFAGGGVSWGKEHFDNCAAQSQISNPTAAGSALGFVTRFCAYDSNPFFQTNLNLNISYPLPLGIQASGAFRSVPGPQLLATATFPNSLIAPSLGRNLASGVNGTSTVELVAPGTLFGDRLNELDFRLAKKFTVAKTKIEGDFDLYNLTNAAPVTALNVSYGTVGTATAGSAWLRPTNLLAGRLAKFGVRVTF
jgi:hypothetical protein